MDLGTRKESRSISGQDGQYPERLKAILKYNVEGESHQYKVEVKLSREKKSEDKARLESPETP